MPVKSTDAAPGVPPLNEKGEPQRQPSNRPLPAFSLSGGRKLVVRGSKAPATGAALPRFTSKVQGSPVRPTPYKMRVWVVGGGDGDPGFSAASGGWVPPGSEGGVGGQPNLCGRFRVTPFGLERLHAPRNKTTRYSSCQSPTQGASARTENAPSFPRPHSQKKKARIETWDGSDPPPNPKKKNN